METPKLWTWAELKVDSSNHKVVLKTKLIHLVSGIRVTNLFQKSVNSLEKKLFSDLLSGEFPHLKKINLSCRDLRSVEPV